MHNPAVPTPEIPTVDPAIIQQRELEKKAREEKEKTKGIEEEKAKITQEAERFLRGSKARVEFRDADGNPMDENLVASLRRDGKLHLETRYEPRSRLPHGHQVDVVNGKIVNPFANGDSQDS